MGQKKVQKRAGRKRFQDGSIENPSSVADSRASRGGVKHAKSPSFAITAESKLAGISRFSTEPF